MDIDGNKILRELSVIAFFFIFIFLLISLATYSSQDPSFNQYLGPDVNISNGGGIIGAYLSGLLVEFLGIASWMIPLIFLLLGIGSLTSRFSLYWYRWLGIFLLFICLICAGSFPWLKEYGLPGDIQGGGYLGETLLKTGVSFLHYTGDLDERLLQALAAAAAAGGDSRGFMSAAVLLVSRDKAPRTLRIDHADDPLADLRSLHRRATTGAYARWAALVPTLDNPERSEPYLDRVE